MTAARRVTVTRSPPRDSFGTGFGAGDEDDAWPGDERLRSIMAAQLGLALRTLAAVGLVLVGLPVLLAAVPWVGAPVFGGVPAVWLLLSVGVQPLWVALAWFHLRRAESTERAAFPDPAEFVGFAECPVPEHAGFAERRDPPERVVPDPGQGIPFR